MAVDEIIEIDGDDAIVFIVHGFGVDDVFLFGRAITRTGWGFVIDGEATRDKLSKCRGNTLDRLQRLSINGYLPPFIPRLVRPFGIVFAQKAICLLFFVSERSDATKVEWLIAKQFVTDANGA